MRILLLRSALAIAITTVPACVRRGAQPGAVGAPQSGAASQPAPDPTLACQHACYRYFECKGGAPEPAVGTACVEDCRGSGGDPAAIDQLASSDCLTVIGAFDGTGAVPPAAAAPAGAAPAASASAAPATAPAGGACPPPGNGSLSQLLVSSAWCHAAYSSAPGTTAQERVVFAVDGRFAQQGGSETSHSGQLTDQAGDQTAAWGTGSQSNGATQGCWRADGSALLLTIGGQAYAPLQLTVTRNSNGYPIINANGKEYSSCQ